MATTKNPINTLLGGIVEGFASIGTANESMTEKRLSEQGNSAAAQEIAVAANINDVNELQDYFDVKKGYFSINLNKGNNLGEAYAAMSRVIKGTELQSYIGGKLETVVMEAITADPDNEGFFVGTAKNKKGEIVPITVGGTDDPDDQVANITQDQIEKQLGSRISRGIARSGGKPPRQLSGILMTLGGPPSLSQPPNTQNSEQEVEQVIARTALHGKKENAVSKLLKMQLVQDLKENPDMSAEEQDDLNRKYVAATRNVDAGILSEAQLDKLGASYYEGDVSKFIASLNKKERTLPTRETYIPAAPSTIDKVTQELIAVPSSGGTRRYRKDVNTYLEDFKEFIDLGGDPELLTGRFKEGFVSRRAKEGGKTLLLEKVMGVIGNDAESLFALQGTLDKARRNLVDSEGKPEGRTNFSDEEITAIVATTLDAKKASAIIGEDLDGVSPTEFVDSANKLGLFSAEEDFVAKMSAEAKQVATDKGLTNIQDVARLNAWEAYTVGVATALASPAAEGSTDFINIIVGMMNIAAGRPFDETAATKAVIQNRTQTTQAARGAALVKRRGDAAKALKDFRETQRSVDKSLDKLRIPGSLSGLAGGHAVFETSYFAAATELKDAMEQSKAIVANASDGVTTFGPNQLKALAGQQQRLMEQTFRFGLYSDTGGKLEGLRELFKGGRVPKSLYSYENMKLSGRNEETGAITDATTVRWNNQEQDLTYGQFRRMVGTELARSTFNFLANLKDYDKAKTREIKQALLLRNNQFDEPAE